LAISGDAQSTAAWKRGSIGESKVAAALAQLPEVRVLNDRRVPGTRGNIDHIAVASSGVFVIDAKSYKGVIRVRNRGGWLERYERLYVGRRDCSSLADGLVWQVTAVQRVLDSVSDQFGSTSVQPVLCFVNGEWSTFAPHAFRGVRLEGLRSITKLVTDGRALNHDTVAGLSRILNTAFPPK